MNAYVEKRNSLRVDVSCKLHCKKADASEFIEVSCVNISCMGISFFCEHNFQVGEEVDVYLDPETRVMPKVQFLIKILRAERREDGTFAVGAAIEYNDENENQEA